jgi:murein DD-endopeptidase MepM/ murein hydrolase activator NlpD
MKNDKLHIIITGEAGDGRSISLQKNSLRNSLIALILLATLLGYGGVQGFYYQQRNWQLQAKNAELTARLQDRTETLNNKLQTSNEALSNEQTSSEQLSRQLAEARNELARVIQEKEEISSSYQQQVATLKQNQEDLLEGSISKLDEQSKVIENVIDQLGVKVKTEEDARHSGGPYIALDENLQNKLISDTERYLTALQKIPLGLPIKTRITSGYGKRKDPLNSRTAFHAGIDFKGRTGDKDKATGKSTVKKSAYNKGLGNYIILSHGDGYETTFAHLSKRLVKRGEAVNRGQVIGLVGNTGRSTGSHLHYEIHHYGKAINPMKYLKVANLTVTASEQ